MSEQEREVEYFIEEFDARTSKEKRVLTNLLDKYSEAKGKFFALRSEMGYTLEDSGRKVRIPSFTIVQSLEWAGKEIKMGSEMPFMSGHIDAKGRLKVDESIAESVKQRSPDWTRQAAIAAYLAHDRRRKFGTIVAVLNPPWVDDPEHENWAAAGSSRRALKSAYRFDALDSRGRIGLLDLEDTLIYALDGQHRVMGINGIRDLRDKGFLELRNRDGQARADNVIRRDDFLEQFGLEVSELQTILSESISIELLPAVLAGETAEQASQRVRSVFITINAYAERAGKGETALLDESDGFAIVARKAGTLHALFKDDRVNWKTSSLPKRTRWYTTLDTLKSMAQAYLTNVLPDLTKAWVPKFKKQVPIRPDEHETEKAREAFFLFIDRIREMPVFKGLESGDDLDDVRLFPTDDPKEHPDAKGHLLVRPVGQVILARAVGSLMREGLTQAEIFERLIALDRAGAFMQSRVDSMWYGVTYDFNKQNMNTRVAENSATELLMYMVRGAKEPVRREVMKFVVESRRAGGTEDRPEWRGFDGKSHTYDPMDPAAAIETAFPRPIASR